MEKETEREKEREVGFRRKTKRGIPRHPRSDGRCRWWWWRRWSSSPTKSSKGMDTSKLGLLLAVLADTGNETKNKKKQKTVTKTNTTATGHRVQSTTKLGNNQKLGN